MLKESKDIYFVKHPHNIKLQEWIIYWKIDPLIKLKYFKDTKKLIELGLS